jgi:hypothetical protein
VEEPQKMVAGFGGLQVHSALLEENVFRIWYEATAGLVKNSSEKNQGRRPEFSSWK